MRNMQYRTAYKSEVYVNFNSANLYKTSCKQLFFIERTKTDIGNKCLDSTGR